jgi:nitrogen fixation-related uncharacterized protein
MDVGTYFTAFAVTLVLATAATWLLSNEDGRKHVQASWWFIFLVISLFLLSYYGSLGASSTNPTVHFPWDYLVAAGIGLIAFFWSVHSAFEIDELGELHLALTQDRPLEPVPETEKPLHGAGDGAGTG